MLASKIPGSKESTHSPLYAYQPEATAVILGPLNVWSASAICFPRIGIVYAVELCSNPEPLKLCQTST